jgi:hypothetical protein
MYVLQIGKYIQKGREEGVREEREVGGNRNWFGLVFVVLFESLSHEFLFVFYNPSIVITCKITYVLQIGRKLGGEGVGGSRRKIRVISF